MGLWNHWWNSMSVPSLHTLYHRIHVMTISLSIFFQRAKSRRETYGVTRRSASTHRILLSQNSRWRCGEKSHMSQNVDFCKKITGFWIWWSIFSPEGPIGPDGKKHGNKNHMGVRFRYIPMIFSLQKPKNIHKKLIRWISPCLNGILIIEDIPSLNFSFLIFRGVEDPQCLAWWIRRCSRTCERRMGPGAGGAV